MSADPNQAPPSRLGCVNSVIWPIVISLCTIQLLLAQFIFFGIPVSEPHFMMSIDVVGSFVSRNDTNGTGLGVALTPSPTLPTVRVNVSVGFWRSIYSIPSIWVVPSAGLNLLCPQTAPIMIISGVFCCIGSIIGIYASLRSVLLYLKHWCLLVRWRLFIVAAFLHSSSFAAAEYLVFRTAVCNGEMIDQRRLGAYSYYAAACILDVALLWGGYRHCEDRYCSQQAYRLRMQQRRRQQEDLEQPFMVHLRNLWEGQDSGQAGSDHHALGYHPPSNMDGEVILRFAPGHLDPKNLSQSIPVLTLSQSWFEDNEANRQGQHLIPSDHSCSICLDQFTVAVAGVQETDCMKDPVRTHCNHYFHASCLTQLFIRKQLADANRVESSAVPDRSGVTCPLCRERLILAKCARLRTQGNQDSSDEPLMGRFEEYDDRL
jgi:hypothetical protein